MSRGAARRGVVVSTAGCLPSCFLLVPLPTYSLAAREEIDHAAARRRKHTFQYAVLLRESLLRSILDASSGQENEDSQTTRQLTRG